MSQPTRDDSSPSQSIASATAPQGTRPTESTSAKRKYGPDLPYASIPQPFNEARERLGKEMNGHWLGSMPVDTFLVKYLSVPEEPLPDMPEDPFKNVPSDGIESKRYDGFISVIEGWIPSLQAVNTSNKVDTENKVNLKPDISIYNRIEGVAPPTTRRTDFSQMELWMEFKVNSNGPAFADPSDEERDAAKENGSFTPATSHGNMARGQLAHYAGALHSLQFRHFSFSVVVQGDEARFLRWDPSGTVVTAAFNFRKTPRTMAEFLWRFNHLSPKDRGHDITVQPANLSPEDDARIREKLAVRKNATLFKYESPGWLSGKGSIYGPRPPTENRSLVSRCTRSLPVVWIPNEDPCDGTWSCEERTSSTTEEKEKLQRWSTERLIYMKDTWRFLSSVPDANVMAEHEIYEILYQHKTPNIPEDVTGGDVEGGRTQTDELLDAEWLCVQPKLSQYQHYRLVHGIVGRPLFKFECTKQLVTGVFDALLAHSHAFNFAKLLHRDISMGNIIFTDEGKGLLIDWEMAKKVDEIGSRRPERTGTWQFMSGNLLQNPGKMHTLTDDLESFLHVLCWTMLRYLPACDSYKAQHRGRDLAVFNEHLVFEDSLDEGGDQKRKAFGSGWYPSTLFKPKLHTPLCELLKELKEPFMSLYKDVPTEDDRKKVQTGPDPSKLELFFLWHSIAAYDTAISRLQSSSWFIDIIKKALDEEVWPANDAGVLDLPTIFGNETKHQITLRTSQQQASHEIIERSKGVLRSSKRAASPTPEPSAKRSRSTPAASGSGA